MVDKVPVLSMQFSQRQEIQSEEMPFVRLEWEICWIHLREHSKSKSVKQNFYEPWSSAIKTNLFNHFKETANSNWLPVTKIKEPNPRPGRCSVDTSTLPESSLSFVKSHSIMDEAVPAFFGGRPLFVKTNLQ